MGCLSEHLSPTGFVVEETPDRSLAPTSDIALVTDHFVMVRDALASELDTCIVSFSDQLGFEAQFEVAILLIAHEEFVVGDFLVEKTGHDGTLFHPEEFLLSFPPVEGLPVEKGNEALFFFLFGCAKAETKQQKE